MADNGLIGDNINLSLVNCRKGEGLKKHTEPCFVFSYILKGKIRVVFDGDVFEARAGDAIYYDGTFPHETEALSDMQLINIYINK